MSLYSQRGVSAQKEEVHAAARSLDPGLYPKAFCKIFPDILGQDKDWVNVMHADGAGTKSILAYLYWKETGDVSVWRGIAQDAIVMNLDDLLCAGIYSNLLFSSTIDRNKKLIPGDVLEAIIAGSQDFFSTMNKYGVHIHYLGGETADVGDLVRTIAVNGTMTSRWPRSKIISNEKIKAGDIIIGLASYGQSSYEDEYNSGIGSNGLTSGRHDLLDKTYATRFPESYDTTMDDQVAYVGDHLLQEEIQADHFENVPSSTVTVGKLLLSPTRTFAPVLKEILEKHFDSIHGLIHCSGGGQTKCLKYMPDKVVIIKDNLFEPPLVFQLIQKASNADQREMYQVFNMGTRMEIYTTEKKSEPIIGIAKAFGIDARVMGRIESGEKKQLIIRNSATELLFDGT